VRGVEGEEREGGPGREGEGLRVLVTERDV
jgi:hypothetical protein